MAPLAADRITRNPVPAGPELQRVDQLQQLIIALGQRPPPQAPIAINIPPLQPRPLYDTLVRLKQEFCGLELLIGPLPAGNFLPNIHQDDDSMQELAADFLQRIIGYHDQFLLIFEDPRQFLEELARPIPAHDEELNKAILDAQSFLGTAVAACIVHINDRPAAPPDLLKTLGGMSLAISRTINVINFYLRIWDQIRRTGAVNCYEKGIRFIVSKTPYRQMMDHYNQDWKFRLAYWFMTEFQWGLEYEGMRVSMIRLRKRMINVARNEGLPIDPEMLAPPDYPPDPLPIRNLFRRNRVNNTRGILGRGQVDETVDDETDQEDEEEEYESESDDTLETDDDETDAEDEEDEDDDNNGPGQNFQGHLRVRPRINNV